jgi:2-polyprenyl-3-methyl-5-hydroxy-6-metoxy-1,4-benzoquinol methylase
VCASFDLCDVPFGYNFKKKWRGVKECNKCGMLFIFPQPTALELKELYSRDYFEGGDYRCGHAGSCFEESERIVSQVLLEKIISMQPKGKFLDIGCAGGQMLNAVRQKGFEPFGVEFSEEAAQNARDKFQLNVITGDIHAAQLESNFFDVVFMGDVLEHVPDPVEVMKEIYRITRPNALVVILCPTQTNTMFSRLGFLFYNIAGKKATVNLPPYHLLEFRPKSMKYLIEHTGFSVVRSEGTAMKPSEIAQRNSLLQNVTKKLMQYPNYALTSVFNICGDRINMFAKKTSFTIYNEI